MHYLHWREAFAKYEAQQTHLRQTGEYIDTDPDPIDVFCQLWPLFEALMRLSNVADEPTDHQIKKLAYSQKAFEYSESLNDIKTAYTVIKSTIDFQTTTSKKVEKLLTKNPRDPHLDRNLLSPDQMKHVKLLLSEIDHWIVSDHDITGAPDNYFRQALYIQNQIDRHGQVDDQGREQLQHLRSSLLSGRQREYASSALIMMLAEFFEDKNVYKHKAFVKKDSTFTSKEEYLDVPEKDEKGDIIPWEVIAYKTPFAAFLRSYFNIFQIGGVSMATAESVTKNRKSLKSKKVIKLCSQSSSKDDIFKLLQILDRVKP